MIERTDEEKIYLCRTQIETKTEKQKSKQQNIINIIQKKNLRGSPMVAAPLGHIAPPSVRSVSRVEITWDP